MSKIVFCITTAEISPNHVYHDLRRSEYHVSLERIKAYNKDILAVCSETHISSCIYELVQKYVPSKLIKPVHSTSELGAITKSQQEYISMYELLKDNTFLNDNDWVIKLSGRYLIIDDTLINNVINADDSTQFIGKKTANNQIHTYFYAIRYGILRDFLFRGISYIGNNCIEKVLFDYLHNNSINTKFIESLGCLTNVANTGVYVIH